MNSNLLLVSPAQLSLVSSPIRKHGYIFVLSETIMDFEMGPRLRADEGPDSYCRLLDNSVRTSQETHSVSITKPNLGK
jgi:hypothetical protein